MNGWHLNPGTLHMDAPLDRASSGIWGPLRRRGLGGLGALVFHQQVRRFQQMMNRMRNSTSAGFSTGVGPLSEDGIYAGQTQTAAERLADWFGRMGVCPGASMTLTRSVGPNNIRNCLRAMSAWATANLRSPGTPGVAANLIASLGPLNVWRSEAVEELQSAWVEWRMDLSPPDDSGGDDFTPDPYAAARAACAASGGTWDAVNHTCLPADAFAGELENCAAAGGTWNEMTNSCDGAGSSVRSARGLIAFITLGATSALVVGTAGKW